MPVCPNCKNEDAQYEELLCEEKADGSGTDYAYACWNCRHEWIVFVPVEKSTETKMGLGLELFVRSFSEMRAFISLCIREGVARCDSCDEPAVRTYWQDKAEWYLQCEAHADYRPQWTGSTRFGAHNLFVPTILDRAKVEAFVQELDEETRRQVKIEEYDRTNYYALLPEDHKPLTDVYLPGAVVDGETLMEETPYSYQWKQQDGWRLRIWALTDGRFAYDLDREHLHEAGGISHGYGLTAPFASAEEAEAAGYRAAASHGWHG